MKTKRFFSKLFPTRQSRTRKLPAHARPNLLRFESLEERTLLSVTPLEYSALQTEYSSFNLPESSQSLNIIPITAEELSVASLKSAISQAGQTTQPDLIVLRTTSDHNTITYAAQSDEITISIDSTQFGSLTIVSLGTDSDGNAIPLTLDAAQLSRVITVSGSTTTLNLGGLTLTGGKSSASDSNTSYGGGIYNDSGTVTVTNSTITGNSASDDGGGIYIFGGGIYNSGTLTVTNSTITGNSVTSSPLSSCGGGIYNYGTLTVTNSTITGNSVTASSYTYHSYGGGIYNYGTLTVTNSTITGNSASDDGGGIYNSSGTLELYNSIVSLNYAKNGNVNLRGTYTGNNNLIGYNPMFVCAPVFSNGVLTNADSLDLRLRSDSPAINAGDNSKVTEEMTDLDGNEWIYDETVDIGAYEYQGDSDNSPISYSSVVDTLEDSFDLDDGKWSLREAIYWAPQYTEITFADSLDGIITLTMGELFVDKALSIDGAGKITLDANQLSRVIRVNAGTEEQPVVLKGLTITGGKTTENGGGIYNYSGTLTVTNSTIEGNSASYGGGGIYNYSGTLTVTNSTITGNSASYGGGIDNRGTLTVTNSTITGNSGDGINNFGTLTITNSTITGNSVSYGGGIDNSGTLTVTNSTITGNSGGGIRSTSGTLELYNSIVSLNSGPNIYGTYTGNNNLIGSNPMFVCAPVFSNGVLTNADSLDLRLRSDSLAINAGDNSKVTEGANDLDGKTRIYDGTVDIGAYEYQGDRSDEPIPYSSVVDTLNDSFDLTDGEWSLREAIYWTTQYTTITFADNLAGTITLSNGQLAIDKALSIDGAGKITLDANKLSRVMLVDAGTTEQPVVLNGLKIENGKSDDGGGIRNFGTLTVTNSTITGNSASYGGGISNGGTLTVTNSTITGNSASYAGNSASYGGGIDNGGTLTVTNSTITGNSASSSDGGIHNSFGTLELYNSIVSLNYAEQNLNCPEQDTSFGTYTGNNNLIGSNPMFVCAPVFSNGVLTNADSLDLRLRSDSPAINAGDNSKVTEGTDDLDGKTRIYDGTVDIGAYEYQGDRSDEPIPYSSVVDTLNDSFDLTDGEWSLREAIYWAPQYTTITFADNLTGTITLSNGQLVVDKALSIDGAGKITLDANKLSRVMLVEAGTTEQPVVFNGLKIENGKSDDGGGIYNNFSTLTVTNSTITGNSASDDGGGIDNNFSTLTVTNSTITGNSASYGGGISNGGTLTITNSTISGNSASDDGGGIYNFYGTLTVTNSTITGNSASYGGGIYNDSDTLTVTNSTIAGNSATTPYGGGIYNSYGKLMLYNSIVSSNMAGDTENDIRNSGTIAAYNTLSSYAGWRVSGSCYVYDSSKPLFTDAANGDYTLAVGSQAIDLGNNDYVSETTDLAGNRRIYNGIVDLGAYEFRVVETLATPTNVSVVSGGGNVMIVRWDEVENANGYIVAYSYDQSAWTEIAAEGTSATISNLNYGQQVYFRVKSHGDNGDYSDSTYSNIVSATTAKITLPAPSLLASSTGSNSISIIVGSVANAAGYSLQYATSSNFANATTKSVTAGTNSITGLAANTTYYFRVMATGTGVYTDSVYSTVESATTGKITLTAPTLSVTATGADSVSVMVGSVANAAGYSLQYATSSNFANATTKSVTAGTNSITGLAANTTYYFRVMAIGAGSYENSAYSMVESTTTGKISLAVPSLSVSATGTNSVSVNVGTVANATGYSLQYSTSSHFTSAITKNVTAGTNSVTGLNAYTTYYFRVKATGEGSYNDSTYSNTVNVTTEKITLSTPTLAISSSGTDYVSVNVGTVANATGYSLQYSTSTNFTSATTQSVSAGINSIRGLAANTTYYFRVMAFGTGSYSDSAYSDTANATTEKITLSTPTLAISSSGTDYVSVNVGTVANAAGYLLQYSTSANFTSATTMSVTPGTNTTHGLAANTTYYFRVMATGAGSYSDSTYSSSINVTTDKLPLRAPALSILSINTHSVTISAGQVENAAGYVLEYSTSSDFTSTIQENISTGNKTIYNLSANTTYYFRIKAVGSGNYADSDYSNTENATTGKIKLAAPTLWAEVDGTTVRCSWSSVVNTSRYSFEYKRSSDTSWTLENVTGTSISFSGMVGETYEIRVKAVGSGDYTDSSYTEREISIEARCDLTFSGSGTVPTTITYGETFSIIAPTIINNGNIDSNPFMVEFHVAKEKSDLFTGNSRLGKWSQKASLSPGSTTTAKLTNASFDLLGIDESCTVYFGWRIVCLNDAETTNNTAVATQTTNISVPQKELAEPSFKIVDKTSNSVQISVKGVENASGYLLEYSTSTNFTSATTKTITAGTNTISGLSANTTYYFRLKATGTGKYSDSDWNTLPVSTLLADGTSSVWGNPDTATSLTIEWKPMSTDYLQYYDVEKWNTETDQWEKVTRLTYHAITDAYPSVRQSTLTPATTYHYRVFSHNGVSLGVTNVTTLLPMPTNFKIDSKTHEEVCLSWDNMGCDSYVVHRSTDQNKDKDTWDKFETMTNSFVDSNVNPNTEYFYYVTQVGEAESQKSTVKSVTTEKDPAAVDEIDNYVVIFSGGGSASSNRADYYYNMVDLYNTCVATYNIPKENIYILYADGTSNLPLYDNERNKYAGDSMYVEHQVLIEKEYRTYAREYRDSNMSFAKGSYIYSATLDNLNLVMDTISGQMDDYDHLLVRTSDHGSGTPGNKNETTDDKLVGWSEYITGEEFADAMFKVTKGYVTLSFAQCFSGGILDDIFDPATDKLLHTASSIDANKWFGMAAANHYESSFSRPERNTAYNADKTRRRQEIIGGGIDFSSTFNDALKEGILNTYCSFNYTKENDPHVASDKSYKNNEGIYTATYNSKKERWEQTSGEHPWCVGGSFDIFATSGSSVSNEMTNNLVSFGLGGIEVVSYDTINDVVALSYQSNLPDGVDLEFQYSTDGGETWENLPYVMDSSGVIVCSVTMGESYSYRGRAVLEGMNTAWVGCDFTPSNAPSAPDALKWETTSTDTLQLTWEDQSNDETGFVVSYSTDNGESWFDYQIVSPNVESTQFTVPDPSLTYQFYVSAIHKYGESDGATAEEFDAAAVPVAPTNLVCSGYDPTTRQLQISWSDNANNETSMRLEYSTDGGENWELLELLALNATSAVLSNVVDNTTYLFRVRAENGNGTSAWSAETNFSTAFLPATPSDIVFSDYSEEGQSLKMSWTDNSHNETGFRVETSLDGEKWYPMGTTETNITTGTYSATLVGVSYHYRVCAINEYGSSEWTTGKFTVSIPLVVPTLNQPTANGTTVSCSWSSVENAEGYVLEYKLASDSQWTTKSVSDTSTTFDGIEGATYHIRVKAIGNDIYEDSDYSQMLPVILYKDLPNGTMVLQKSSHNYTTANATDEIPDSVVMISDWDSFYGEIWSEGVNVQKARDSVSVKVTYNPKLFIIKELLNVPEGITGMISEGVMGDDGNVTVDVTFTVGENGFTANGVNTFWGSIYFTPAQTEGSGVSGLTTTEPVGISVNQQVLETKVEALPYDMNQDHHINITDLIAFAKLFGNSIAENERSAQADYNKDGYVNIKDLILFAKNFGLKKGDSGVVVPETRSNNILQVVEISEDTESEPLKTSVAAEPQPVAAMAWNVEREPADVSTTLTNPSVNLTEVLFPWEDEEAAISLLATQYEPVVSASVMPSAVDEVFQENDFLAWDVPTVQDPVEPLFNDDPLEWKRLRVGK